MTTFESLLVWTAYLATLGVFLKRQAKPKKGEYADLYDIALTSHQTRAEVETLKALVLQIRNMVCARPGDPPTIKG